MFIPSIAYFFDVGHFYILVFFLFTIEKYETDIEIKFMTYIFLIYLKHSTHIYYYRHYLKIIIFVGLCYFWIFFFRWGSRFWRRCGSFGEGR